MCIYGFSLSIISSVDKDFFHLLPFVKKVTMNMGVWIFLWDLFSVPLDKHPEVGLQDHMGNLVLIFEELPYCFPQQPKHFTFPLTVQKGSDFYISLSMVIFHLFLYSGHTNERWYLTVALICISLMINDTEYLFRCLLVVCVSLGETSI